MDDKFIFLFPSTETAISMDNKKPSAKLEFTCYSYLSALRVIDISLSISYQVNVA